jgi:20S proteasome alpha/beta subunit
MGKLFCLGDVFFQAEADESITVDQFRMLVCLIVHRSRALTLLAFTVVAGLSTDMGRVYI